MSSLLCLTFTLRATPTPSSEAFGCANATRYKGFLYLHNNIRNNIFSPPTLGQPVLFAVLGMNIHLSLIGTKQEDNGREGGGAGLQFYVYLWQDMTRDHRRLTLTKDTRLVFQEMQPGEKIFCLVGMTNYLQSGQ